MGERGAALAALQCERVWRRPKGDPCTPNCGLLPIGSDAVWARSRCERTLGLFISGVYHRRGRFHPTRNAVAPTSLRNGYSVLLINKARGRAFTGPGNFIYLFIFGERGGGALELAKLS